MKAIAIKQQQLQYGTQPVPEPKEGEVLIRVAAAGVNRADIFQRQGKYPPPAGASPLPGLEVSGHIEALGAGVEGWKKGDAVCALLEGGGYAEYATAPAAQLLPMPKGYSLLQAAGLPEALFTVWLNLFGSAAIQPGETLLLHGGASGIGTLAIQIAKARGIISYATAGTRAKCDAIETLGAAAAIEYTKEDFLEKIKQLTRERGVDVVLDIVGGSYFERNLKALAPYGRMVVLSLLGGAHTEASLAPLLLKNLTVMGRTLRGRSAAEKAALATLLKEEALPLLSSGQVVPVVDKIFPLAEAAAAHAHMEASRHIGKIILQCR